MWSIIHVPCVSAVELVSQRTSGGLQTEILCFLQHQLAWVISESLTTYKTCPSGHSAAYEVRQQIYGNLCTYFFASRRLLAVPAARLLQELSPSQAMIFFSFCLRIFCYSSCAQKYKQDLTRLINSCFRKPRKSFSPTSLRYDWCSVWCAWEDVLSQVKFCRIDTENQLQLSKAANHLS